MSSVALYQQVEQVVHDQTFARLARAVPDHPEQVEGAMRILETAGVLRKRTREIMLDLAMAARVAEAR